ncbi:MAG: DUF1822 family protein [Trichodesmium sp. MAG_R01]|nr:DUF1822 family protein [Trichodesmium sp. MAG_R01]
MELVINQQKVALVINIFSQTAQEVRVLIQIHSLFKLFYLPSGLKIRVDLNSDSVELEAGEADKFIQLEFIELLNSQFRVNKMLNSITINGYFVT